MNFRTEILILNLLPLIRTVKLGRWSARSFSDECSCNCTQDIPHGQAESCLLARICSYTCFKGYKKHDDINYIACSLSGQWLTFAEPTVEDLCTGLLTTKVTLAPFSTTQVTFGTEAFRCPLTIANGQVSSTNCSRLRWSTCSDFICNPGFHTPGAVLHCNKYRRWEYSGTPCISTQSEYHTTLGPIPSDPNDTNVVVIVISSILGLLILISLLTYAWHTRCRTRSKFTGSNLPATTAIRHTGNSVRETPTDSRNIRRTETTTVSPYDERSVVEMQTAHMGRSITQTNRDQVLGHTATGTHRNERSVHLASVNAVYSVQTNERATSQLNQDCEHQLSRHIYPSEHRDGPPAYSGSAISVQSEPIEALPSYEPPPPYESTLFYEPSPSNESPLSYEPSPSDEPYDPPPCYEPPPRYEPPSSYQPPPSY